MFEDLDDPHPVAPGPEHRAAVERRAGRLAAARRSRRQRMVGAGLAVVAILGVGSVVAVRSEGSHGSRSALPALRHVPAPAGSPSATPTTGNRAAGTIPAPMSPQLNSNGAVSATGTTSATGCVGTDACRYGVIPPSFVDGTLRGEIPPAGTGAGTDGACTGAETAPPCASGVVAGRFYAATIPTGCGHPTVFDGRTWWSNRTSVPGARGETVHAWLRLASDRTVDVVAPFGALTLTPVTKRSPKRCSPLKP
jgi:hypothetical protein